MSLLFFHSLFALLDRIITKIQESGGLEKIFHVMKSSLSSEVGKCAAGALLACSRNGLYSLIFRVFFSYSLYLSFVSVFVIGSISMLDVDESTLFFLS